MEGDVTVVDAILWSIDVDADFSADAGLQWVDTAEGQTIEPFVIGEPDVDLSLLAWILSFLLGFLTFGIIGGIIAIVVLAVAESTAEKVGGAVIRDEVTGQIKSIGAWPQSLDNIGTILSRFENPIGIDPEGVLFAGNLTFTSFFMLTVSDPADSNGPYFAAGNQMINFNGGLDIPDTSILWDFGDSNSSLIRQTNHSYGKSGL